MNGVLAGRPALVVVDAQQGFDDPSWGPTNNPGCDTNIDRLVTAWAEHGLPLVYVRHDSALPGSPLHPGHPGNRLRGYLRPEPDLLVTKTVNSSFHGTPDLHAWLGATGTTGIVVCGEFAEVVSTDGVLEALAEALPPSGSSADDE